MRSATPLRVEGVRREHTVDGGKWRFQTEIWQYPSHAILVMVQATVWTSLATPLGAIVPVLESKVGLFARYLDRLMVAPKLE